MTSDIANSSSTISAEQSSADYDKALGYFFRRDPIVHTYTHPNRPFGYTMQTAIASRPVTDNACTDEAVNFAITTRCSGIDPPTDESKAESVALMAELRQHLRETISRFATRGPTLDAAKLSTAHIAAEGFDDAVASAVRSCRMGKRGWLHGTIHKQLWNAPSFPWSAKVDSVSGRSEVDHVSERASSKSLEDDHGAAGDNLSTD